MFNSLRKKYALTGVGLILAFLLVSLLLNGLLKEPFLIWENHRKMEAICDQIQRWMREDREGLQKNIEELGFQENVKISIFGEDYQILATTQLRGEREKSVKEKLVKKLKAIRDILDKEGVYFRKDERKGRKDLSYLVQVEKAGSLGYVVVRKSIPGIQKNMMLMDLFYVLSSLVTLAAGSVIIVWLAGKMVRPLENMNQVTRRIAQLDFEESVQVKSKDELGTLAASINSMSDQLKFNMEELQKELEFRKGMLRSLAHELKTPIAVIEGYTEHMPYIAESQPQKLQKYVDVIAKECVRMDQMIREILELCAYENRGNIVQVTAFSSGIFLRELAQQTWEEFSRTVEILDEIDGYIAGDYQMLQRAVYNYIKNAVFHSRDAGIIRLTARNEGQNWIFSVYNSGSHIDEAELEKIWEVFYKSDQARTRERTSCGIGLAIAKEVAHAHRGRTWAKNMTDGVEFYLSIPSSSVDKKGG